ncbi:cytochrome P450 11B2 [Apodospora peruviana]|uniref:Cytochrome P450 11B2 n=1 Tax=Apodospora peruviana TaxID=516989 RepID=A0AAE0HX73_9PEZI|nr:cytochrome P450 11B2 [Apodospora peruviana]
MALLNKSTLLVAGLLALVLYNLVTRTRAYLRLRHIKGPRGAGWGKFWLTRHQFGGKLIKDLQTVCKEYGPLTRIGPDWVVCSDPTEIRRIWSVHSGYQRSPWYRGFRFDPQRDSLITANENKEHHRIRSLVIPGYSGRGLADPEVYVDDAIGKFLGVIEQKYVSTSATGIKLFNAGHKMQYFTQDANSAIEFGKPFGYLDHDSDFNGIIGAIETMVPATAVMALFPVTLRIMDSGLLNPFLPKLTDQTGVGRLLGIVHEKVGERYTPDEKKEKRRDVLQAFVDSKMTRQEVEAEALVHLLGGSDTTATSIRVTLFYLATKPSAHRALQREVDEFVRAGKASRPVITDAEAKSMPYLQACIKEGLRLWPPVSGLMAKVSQKDDVICGQKVPAGTNVAWTALGVMRNRELFGEDADTFEPRRWLEADPARLREMEAVQGLAFAANSRWQCLGMKLAYLEMGKLFFELFLRYDFAMADPIQPYSWVNYGFTMHENMNFLITQREVEV